MHYITTALKHALNEFRTKMLMGKKLDAVMALHAFHQQYSGCKDHELITALREFVVLNPFHHLPGNVEAVNLLQELDLNFREEGIGALHEQIATLTQAAQNPSFDLGYDLVYND